MTLHLSDVREVTNLLTILDEVFPPDERHLDFPDDLQYLDLVFVLRHGAVSLDEDNLFAYLCGTDAESNLVETMMSTKHQGVTPTDDPKLTRVVDKIALVAKKLSVAGEHGVLFIKADQHFPDTSYTERLVEMTAPHGWPVVAPSSSNNDDAA